MLLAYLYEEQQEKGKGKGNEQFKLYSGKWSENDFSSMLQLIKDLPDTCVEHFDKAALTMPTDRWQCCSRTQDLGYVMLKTQVLDADVDFLTHIPSIK